MMTSLRAGSGGTSQDRNVTSEQHDFLHPQDVQTRLPGCLTIPITMCPGGGRSAA
jgi:hypothetical protein